MPDIYVNLLHTEYKAMEDACRAFIETTHGEGTEYYHKSFRFPLGEGVTVEVHGPGVKARQPEAERSTGGVGESRTFRPDKDICCHDSTDYTPGAGGIVRRVCKDCGEILPSEGDPATYDRKAICDHPYVAGFGREGTSALEKVCTTCWLTLADNTPLGHKP